MKNRLSQRSKWGVLGIALLLSFLLTACGAQKLSEDFDEEVIQSSVADVIGYITNQDSEGLLEISNVKMKGALTDEVLDQIFEAIEEGGAYVEIVSTSMSGYKDKSTEEEFAVVVAKVKYENRNFIYTLYFTKQMKLAGLYYK